jgi:hypothetical protein
MKTLSAGLISLAILSAPLVGFAQSTSQSVTRAEVQRDLAAVEKAGWSPRATEWNYPTDLEQAEAHVQQTHMQATRDVKSAVQPSSYGPSIGGTSSADTAVKKQ